MERAPDAAGPENHVVPHVTLHSEVELNPQERDPLYMRFTDFYCNGRGAAALAITVGKQGVPFTMDGATSSKELITIDRSNLTNNMWFPQEYIPGVSVSGKVARWKYRGGVYSSGEANREFGEFSGGAFTLGVLGYDFAQRLGVKEALLTGNYVYQHPDQDNTFTRRLEHVAFDQPEARRRQVGRANRRLGRGRVPGSERPLGLHGACRSSTSPTSCSSSRAIPFLDSADPNGVLLAPMRAAWSQAGATSTTRCIWRELLLLRPQAQAAERASVR